MDSVPWHARLGWRPVLGSWKAGWWSVDVWGVNNLSESPNTKGWVQLSTGLGVNVGGGLAVEAGVSRMTWDRATSLGQSVLAGLSYTR